MTDGRRIKILKLGPRFPAGLLSEGNHFFRVTENAMPEDATIVGAQWDHRNGDLLLQVHSKTFAPCPEGSHFEQVQPKLEAFNVLADLMRILSGDPGPDQRRATSEPS